MTISNSLKLLNIGNAIKTNEIDYNNKKFLNNNINQNINETSKWVPNILWRGQGGKNIIAF
ncbi:hypothetical protein DDB_G0282523 [Dictyostelium discoideum AX4]|uniref:Putative uncharacterized protein DDB_G0282523 n=1 Tax=Dictyostelium discoideum TaxID=44689 RepID=Y4813_DICDI|nr:hypothetical protein DDB_G0282523 [Dictyostelium discoideum AX4]Q54SD7.1 RecName: Full=Putative uncharacterized protein DDB_G0282523 [Dictyostelium discoideum]EAL66121.1 hypothetical protein DDB_G0282523 [Dictyostelium discoideum AX4]|eukprot:XP_640102.1 hypothetical protein DDB_G0282523 [Dictyostelium discoideum AX4]